MIKKFLLHNDKKMRTAHAQNCTFASSNKQADASACKRAVFWTMLTENKDIYKLVAILRKPKNK
jgi:hypothetical protein